MDEYGQRAKVFDALSHPTRIRILKVLQKEALSFADLKKRMGIESGGHLQHHLNKLENLIKTDEYGKYCLSEEGEDALFAMQTIEKVAESGEKAHVHANGLGMRRFLIGIITLLAVVSLASSLYMSNSDLVGSQYFYDVVEGSPFKENANLHMGPCSFEIPVGHTYNFTALVFSTLSPPTIHYFDNNSGTFEAPPPIITGTYYRMGFIGFHMNLTAGELYTVYFGPATGPDNSEAQQVVNPYEAPPYKTETVEPFTMAASGGLQITHEYHIPITAFGNYTFRIVNIGNTTIKAWCEVWASTVIMETRPLKGGETFSAVKTFNTEQVVRIRWRPTPLYLVAMGVAIGSPVTLAALSIYLLNHKIHARQL